MTHIQKKMKAGLQNPSETMANGKIHPQKNIIRNKKNWEVHALFQACKQKSFKQVPF